MRSIRSSCYAGEDLRFVELSSISICSSQLDDSHNITLGSFLGRSEAADVNFQYRVVSEFNNNPRLVDLAYNDVDGNAVTYSQGGIYNRIGQTSNRFLRQNRTAFYLTDKIIANQWRFDLGFKLNMSSYLVRKVKFD